MSRVTTIFWDVGGVLLSNACGREARAAAVTRFDFASEDFERDRRISPVGRPLVSVEHAR